MKTYDEFLENEEVQAKVKKNFSVIKVKAEMI